MPQVVQDRTGYLNIKQQQPLITQSSIPDLEPPITPAHSIELFNGIDFSGFKFCMKDNSDPTNTWVVSDGTIKCTGRPAGYLRTERSYRDYKLTVVWRFMKIAPQADNTGVLVHIQLPDKVWPVCVQVQGKHDNMGDLFLMAGAESREHRGMDANEPLPKREPSNEKAAGEWNTVVTVCSGNTVKAFVNGRLMNETTDCTISSGFIGIQSEGAELEIRRIVIEPLQ